ncbi:tetratricopeptide repeat protein, partial [Candidatus Thorarchaeota archaeon]
MVSLKINKDDVPKDAWDLFESAMKDEQAGQKSKAKEKYEKAVELFPKFEAAWINLAMVYQDLGDAVMPLAIARQGLENVPESSALWTSLGSFYSRIQMMESSAEDAYRKAIEFDSTNYVAVLNLSSILAQQEKLQEAEKIISTILEAPTPDNLYTDTRQILSFLWSQLAFFRAQIGKTEGVQEACEKALEMDNTNPRVLQFVARARALIGDMTSVDKKVTSDADSMYDIALTLDRQKEYTKAIEAYKQVLSINPSHTHARANLGAVLVDLERYEEGEKILRPLIENDPTNHIAWINLGKALIGLGNNEEAEAAMKRVVEIKPDYTNGWYQLAGIYDRQGRLQEAEGAFRKTVEYKPDHFRAWCDLGVTLIQLGRNPEAEGPLRNATKYGPEDVKSWSNLGLYYTMLNRCAEAKEAIENARRIDPDDRHL